jgi:hypothetical protein
MSSFLLSFSKRKPPSNEKSNVLSEGKSNTQSKGQSNVLSEGQSNTQSEEQSNALSEEETRNKIIEKVEEIKDKVSECTDNFLNFSNKLNNSTQKINDTSDTKLSDFAFSFVFTMLDDINNNIIGHFNFFKILLNNDSANFGSYKVNLSGQANIDIDEFNKLQCAEEKIKNINNSRNSILVNLNSIKNVFITNEIDKLLQPNTDNIKIFDDFYNDKIEKLIVLKEKFEEINKKISINGGKKKTIKYRKGKQGKIGKHTNHKNKTQRFNR